MTNSNSTGSVEATRGESYYEYRSNLQSLRSWFNEFFESEEAKVFFGIWATHVSSSPDDVGGGNLAYLFSVLVQDEGNNVVRGRMGNLSIALSRYLQLKGGKIFTSIGISKIIINDNGRAVGVRLDNGSYIGVRRLVVSRIEPLLLHWKSNCIFTVWQHLSLLIIRQYEGNSYRMFTEWLVEAHYLRISSKYIFL